MKIVFLYNGSESIGVESLSAYLKYHGHDTALVFDPAHFRGNRGRDNAFLARFFDPSRETLIKAILQENPDVLACSCITGNYRWALDLAEEAKRKSEKPLVTIFGGVHPSMVPERVISQPVVDALVVGEGEGAILELVNSLQNGEFTDTKVANAWIKSNGTICRNPVRPYIRDLDSLPLPDKELFYQKVPFLRRGYMLMTARGCPYNCTFCSNSTYHKIYKGEKGHVRRLSVPRVIEELQWAISQGHIEYLNIYDDIFTLDREWLEEFVPLYKKEIDLPFICNIHPNFCDTDQVRLIKEAGCETVRLGVQTVHEPTLKSLLHRSGSRENVAQAIETLQKHKVHIKIEHIMGLPGEGSEIQHDAIAFYNEHRPSKILSFWLTLYPGTKILKTALELELISEQEAEDLEEANPRLKFTHFLPDPIKGTNQNQLKRFTLLFDLMPFLPKSLVRWILARKLYRYFPHSNILHQGLVVLNALVNRDREDIHALLYVLARKRSL